MRVARPGRGLPDGGQDLAQALPADGGRPLRPEVLRPPPRPGDLHQPRQPGRGLLTVLLVDNLQWPTTVVTILEKGLNIFVA